MKRLRSKINGDRAAKAVQENGRRNSTGKVSLSTPGTETCPLGFVDVTVISAQNLKDVGMFASMSPYVVVWVDITSKQRTQPATGTSPVWDHSLRVVFPATLRNPPALVLEVYNSGTLSDTLLGSVQIPLPQIISQPGIAQYMACQLVRPSGRIQGLLNISLQYTEAPALSSIPFRNSWMFLDQPEALTSSNAASISAPDLLDSRTNGHPQPQSGFWTNFPDPVPTVAVHVAGSSGSSDIFENNFHMMTVAAGAACLLPPTSPSPVNLFQQPVNDGPTAAILGMAFSQPSPAPDVVNHTHHEDHNE